MLTLVTGATGLVGTNVVRLLLERGERVRLLTRTDGGRALEGLAVETCRGDIRDPAAVRKACRGVNRVVHAAAEVRIGWTGMAEHRAVNVEGTRHVAEAALAEGARLVHVSSVNALGLGTRESPANEETPPGETVATPYVLTKREAEQVVLAAVARGLDAVIVNPAYMLGPWDWKPSSGLMLLKVATGWAKLAPPGGNDFCDVRDVAAGILAALVARGERAGRYIVGGELMSFIDAWRMFAEIVHVPPPWWKLRWPGIFVIGRTGDLCTRLTGREPAWNSAALAMSKLDHHYSYARAAAELGYRPRASRGRRREAAWEWFREHGYVKSS